MSARKASLRPPYPVFRNERFTGCLPPPPIQVYELRPSERNPAYTQYAGAHGRHLSGIDMMNAEPIQDYANELDVLQVADDVQGNGVFDPAGSHGNIHPDEGIFQDHESIPGYLARDRFYTPSEVRDATTDKPVMFVPGGAVAIDDAQEQAFQNRLLWQLPPGVNPWPAVEAPSQSTVTPSEASWPVRGVGQEAKDAAASTTKMFLVSAAAGLSVGMLLALVVPTKAKKR